MKNSLTTGLIALVLTPACGLKAPETGNETLGSGTNAGDQTESQDLAKTSCLGTEPFWSLNVQDGQIRFDMAGTAPNIYELIERRSFNGTSADFAEALTGEHVGDFAESISVSILLQQCSDGMSDNLYPYRTVIQKGHQFFTGCCGQPTPIDSDTDRE